MKQNFNTQTQPINSNQNKEINILNDIEYVNCQRCKVKKSVFSCIVCESFKFLCTKCDNYVHSLPSKQSHSRIAILDKTNQKDNNKQEEEKVQLNTEHSITNTIPNNSNNIYKNENNNNNNNSNLGYETANDMNYKFNLSPINKEKNLNSYTYNQNFKREITNENNNNINNYNQMNHNNYNVDNNTSINMNKIENNPQYIQNTESSINQVCKNNNNNNNINNKSLNQSQLQYQNSSNDNYNNNNFPSFRIPNAQNFSREYVYELKVK